MFSLNAVKEQMHSVRDVIEPKLRVTHISRPPVDHRRGTKIALE